MLGEPVAQETAIPVEPDGGIGDGAGPPPGMVQSGTVSDTEEPSAFAQSFPVAIRGKWRETDGPPPSAAQCDGSNVENIGMVLKVYADSYAIFEEGGRFITVSERSPGKIRALFDTTYADRPTRDEFTFQVDPVARTLTVIHHGTGQPSGQVYKRCPADD